MTRGRLDGAGDGLFTARRDWGRGGGAAGNRKWLKRIGRELEMAGMRLEGQLEEWKVARNGLKMKNVTRDG